ncbi:TRX_family domain containing protein [uncultured Caudovirales phage]|uniref:TRX_family domain containing protein n=1 Tax=uncultured Caudovirales phage TaxID=2100421 RepID=A0A6J5Q8L5_9CAUD|nr:TRX_family domain containing protein [uncultured Caudovirales phage]
MKAVFVFVLFLVGCAAVCRVAPREVSRAKAEAAERAELVASLEREVTETNHLRSELEAIADEPPAAALVGDPIGYTPRLIVFTAIEWCPPCRKFDVEIKRLGEMGYTGADGKPHKWSEMIGRDPDNAIQVIDISDESDSASAEMAMKYLVEAVPTIVRIDADGKQESRFSGVMDAETLCRYQAGKWKPPAQPNALNVVTVAE